ncbi:phosphoenolpyruvate--protein phosphotransferase [Methylobacillus flagellatus]|uniref:phosphoenolpyruvate--protein phosphotransferase n=1 Tax=Methylobacillus flagellatus TaxID=405 RepID=UPI0010F6908B|nr:phosphoenolpyruvate--protein phosphotransferase [Methylobacillus flagellatus]
MIQLGKQSIKLAASAADKAAAIRTVGQLLVDNGNMQAAYIDSMQQREQVANTYLGNGIAIPHGLPKDRDLIARTGIAVAQFPQGVQWNQGEMVYLLVGIAAKSDEHIELLTNLTHVLDDAAAIQQLAQTCNAQDIIDCLTRGHDAVPAACSAPHEDDFACYEEVVLPGKAGMHARPATAFVDIAKQFHAEVRVRCGDKLANGKSTLALLKLGAAHQAVLRIMAQGDDAALAVKTLAQAVRDGLEEEEEHELAPAYCLPSLNLAGNAIVGIAGAAGLAIAPLHHFRHEKLVVAVTANDAEQETTSLQQAIAHARVQLQQLHDDVLARSGAARAAIFLAHQEFLSDPDLLQGAQASISAGHSAGWAWRHSVEQRVAEIASLDDARLKERAADLQDVGNRVLRLLAGVLEQELQQPAHPVILVAEDLSPSDTAKLDPSRVLGICTAAGGPTSHTAIIARSLDIPAVVSAGPAVLSLVEGTLCILDGDGGKLYANPDEADLVVARSAQQDHAARRAAEALACYQPAILRDGHRVEVVANIGNAVEAAQAVDAGAEGIGLLRTEFLFLQRATPPDEDEQFDAYHTMTRALNGLPLIIRTLDIGGDKEVPYLSLPAEQNPFLGMRGIRLCLERPDLFRPQLRAIYRAAATGSVRIMFPMIATLDELLVAKAMAEEVRQELNAPKVEIGIMIEVPSAVLMAPELARHVDFFSIGTNDLTQYVLAMDRLHPSLARQADALHPAVLRMIDLTVKAARANGIWVGVCGGIAGDPKGAAILTGIGVAELSVSIPSVAAIKAKLRLHTLAECQALAGAALQAATTAEVRALSMPVSPAAAKTVPRVDRAI